MSTVNFVNWDCFSKAAIEAIKGDLKIYFALDNIKIVNHRNIITNYFIQN